MSFPTSNDGLSLLMIFFLCLPMAHLMTLCNIAHFVGVHGYLFSCHAKIRTASRKHKKKTSSQTVTRSFAKFSVHHIGLTESRSNRFGLERANIRLVTKNVQKKMRAERFSAKVLSESFGSEIFPCNETAILRSVEC